jgi:hypothetical protein
MQIYKKIWPFPTFENLSKTVNFEPFFEKITKYIVEITRGKN